MAYVRYDTRGTHRDERSRWSEGRETDRDFGRGRREDRGFFERAGDEIASWFGDEDMDRRRRQEVRRSEGRSDDPYRERGWNSDRDFGKDRNWNDNRGLFARGGSSERDYNSAWRRELPGRDYRPISGDYERAERESGQFFGESGYRDERFYRDRSSSPWGLDEYRRTSRAGTMDWSDRSRHEDPHYESWRRRHMAELDRDYAEYRSENQERFENDFSSWRDRRLKKRSLLGLVREHMEVVGSDGPHVGTVERIAGDRIILTKSDPESGGVHHSLSCTDIDHIEGDQIVLNCSADQARERWRNEKRNRALFEREDRGETGPQTVERSFEGTHR